METIMIPDELKSHIQSFQQETNGQLLELTNGEQLSYELTWPTGGEDGYIEVVPHPDGVTLQYGIKKSNGLRCNGGVLFVPPSGNLRKRLDLLKRDIESGKAVIEGPRWLSSQQPQIAVAQGFKIR